MTGPLKNPKHERFAQEYHQTRKASAAALSSGIVWKSSGTGFYVYFLIDPRTDAIFYIGKGKGSRLSQHVKSAWRQGATNGVKCRLIRDIIANGYKVSEIIFADELNEIEAYAIERDLISRWKHSGLTNMASGTVTAEESVLADIELGISMIKPYDQWIRDAHPRQIEAAITLSGSTRCFYDFFMSQMFELLDDAQRCLELAKKKAA